MSMFENVNMKTKPTQLLYEVKRRAMHVKDRLEQAKRAGVEELDLRYYYLNDELRRCLERNGGYLLYFESTYNNDYYTHFRERCDEKEWSLDETLDYITDITTHDYMELAELEEIGGEVYYPYINVFYRFCSSLENEIRSTYDMLTKLGRPPREPVVAFTCFLEGFLIDAKGIPRSLTIPSIDIEKQNNTVDESSNNKRHINMDDKEAKKLYRAVSAPEVKWLADEDLDEVSFVNRLTLPPDGNKIILKQLNQVYYITNKYIFPPTKGKTLRRKTKDEWQLIKDVFDAKDGSMMRVEGANKKPAGYKEVDKYMKSEG